MRLILLVFSCTSILVVLTPFLAFVSGSETPGRITCYYGPWAMYRSEGDSYGVDDIPGDKCTHIIYAFLVLNETTWKVQFKDYNLDFTEGNIQKFLGLKQKYPNVSLSIAIGGGKDGSLKYSQMAEVPTRRQIFIDSLVAFLRKYAFDGVDMDWEYPGVEWSGGRSQDKVNFVTLMADLRTALNSVKGVHKELTMAASIVQSSVASAYDVKSLCKIVDAVHLMAYDLRGSWGDYVDVHSPLYRRPSDTGPYTTLNTHDGTLHWRNEGCPNQKLIVGVPFYGHKFILKDSKKHSAGDPMDVTATKALRDNGVVIYCRICRSFLGGGGWYRVFDELVKTPYIFKGTEWIGYEDKVSLQYKANWVKSEGLGGIMIWAIDQDDFKGHCGPINPLISTLHETLKDYIVP